MSEQESYPSPDDVQRLRDKVLESEPSAALMFRGVWTPEYLRTVMTRPSKEDRSKMRSFDYSVKKLLKAFKYYKKYDVKSLSTDTMPEDVAAAARCASIYWRDCDRSGRPILWVRNKRKDWYNVDVKVQRRLHIWMIEWGLRRLPNTTENTTKDTNQKQTNQPEDETKQQNKAKSSIAREGDNNLGGGGGDGSFGGWTSGCSSSSVHEFIIVADTHGMSLRQMMQMRYTKMLIEVFMALYPDRVKALVVGPTGIVLRKMYSLVSPLLPRNVQEKIHLVSTKPESLSPYLDKSKIPDFFSGSNKSHDTLLEQPSHSPPTTVTFDSKPAIHRAATSKPSFIDSLTDVDATITAHRRSDSKDSHHEREQYDDITQSVPKLPRAESMPGPSSGMSLDSKKKRMRRPEIETISENPETGPSFSLARMSSYQEASLASLACRPSQTKPL